jgi:hypothetical protein
VSARPTGTATFTTVSGRSSIGRRRPLLTTPTASQATQASPRMIATVRTRITVSNHARACTDRRASISCTRMWTRSRAAEALPRNTTQTNAVVATSAAPRMGADRT